MSSSLAADAGALRQFCVSRRVAWLCLVGLPFQTACAARSETLRERQLVQVDGCAISIRHRRAHNGPTVVFESGLGDGLDVWDGVLSQLHPSIAYFAYSRPGYGASDPVRQREVLRTSGHASALLHVLLQRGGVRPPYLLVGHSLGGLYIARYGALYPNDVAGLLFVDARPPGFRASCAARDIQFCSTIAPPPANWPDHILAESAGIEASEDAAPAAGVLASIPATIITSTRPWPGDQGPEAFELWLEQQQAFANGFEIGRFVRAEGAGHYIHREQPALVAGEIETLLRMSG